MFRRRVFTHHHVGDSRLAPVYGRQFVLPSCLESDCQAQHRVRIALRQCDVSAKHHACYSL
ncbi:MAG: hypothetical protein LBI18_06765 [Planctomycetaceae bacterium]|nr:hypothetical protein [Planctomycetaceae bacterium]